METYIKYLIVVNLLINFFVAGFSFASADRPTSRKEGIKTIFLILFLMAIGLEFFMVAFIFGLIRDFINWLAGITQIVFYFEYHRGVYKNLHEIQIKVLNQRIAYYQNRKKDNKRINWGGQHFLHCIDILNKKYNYKLGTETKN